MASDQENATFDPSLTGSANDGIYGIATTIEQSSLIYIPVPWELTTSYGKGTANGPEAIRQASPQLDLFIPGLANHYESGFHMLDANPRIEQLNNHLAASAAAIQQTLENTGKLEDDALLVARDEINRGSAEVNDIVYRLCQDLDREGKYLAVVGGDHSSPFGLIRFLSEKHAGEFGVLHIDAHLDLRESYQGFTYSHASIMRNVMSLENRPRALVQVGIRDYCEQEWVFAEADPRITVFYDEAIKESLYKGETFASVVNSIIATLPNQVYISFDIDGLKPALAPHTGTPVAGGLEFEQAAYLIRSLVKSGRRIIGFDLCEVCPNPRDPSDEWDGNVGARILFLLSSWMMESQQR